METIENFRKKSHKVKKGKGLILPKEVERGTLLHWNGFVFQVRGFECVQNQELSAYGKRARSTKREPIALKRRKKLAIVRVMIFLRHIK